LEAEPGQGLSTRKLLIESAKHNVITAYSAREMLEMFMRFPKVDAVVIDAELKGNELIAKRIKQHPPKMPVLCLTPRIAAKADWADDSVNPHNPAELPKMLEKMGGRTDI
jgi:DNA-binding response OmpR family regulator